MVKTAFPLLKTINLSFAYQKQPHETDFVLKNINMELSKGKFHFLIGPNGTGKTTLMRCLLGLLKPQNGEIILQGKAIDEWSHRQRAKILSYIPQNMEQSFNFTVIDAVLMGKATQLSAFAKPSKADQDVALTTLEKLNISHLAHRGLQEISGGEQQLVRIARALIQDAEILIMDEPTANLDYGNQYRLLQQIAMLTQEGYTILLSTHQPQHALDFGDEVIALHQRSIYVQGKPVDCVSRELMQTIYQQDCHFIFENNDGHTDGNTDGNFDETMDGHFDGTMVKKRRKIIIPDL